jgi:hypothetical protein
MQKLVCALTLVFLFPVNSTAEGDLALGYVQKRFDALASRGIVNPSYPKGDFVLGLALGYAQKQLDALAGRGIVKPSCPDVDQGTVLPITKSLGFELDAITEPARGVVYFDARPSLFANRLIWR